MRNRQLEEAIKLARSFEHLKWPQFILDAMKPKKEGISRQIVECHESHLWARASAEKLRTRA